MKAISGKELCRVVEQHGWIQQRIRGSHHIYSKTGSICALVDPRTRKQAAQDWASEAPDETHWTNRSRFGVKLSYDSETDSLYVDLSAKVSVTSREIADGLVIDFDEEGHVVGIDIEHASRHLDLKTVETEALPIPS